MSGLAKRFRQRPPARMPAHKFPKCRMLIVTEGAVTEKKYLEGLIASLRNSRIEFRVVGGVGVPKTIVETAMALKRAASDKARLEQDDNLEYEQVWCAFDVDQHPNIPDARKLAEQHRIDLAISNPCFELWLWLHFADQPGACNSRELQDMLKQFIPDYRKHVRFEDLASGYLVAVRRARALDQQAVDDHDEGRNPTTGFWRLTESIRDNS